MSQVDFNDPAVIAALTNALEAAGVGGLEISTPTQKLRIVLAAGQHAKGPEASATVIKAPMAGIFISDASAIRAPAGHASPPQNEADIAGFLRVGPVLLPLRTGDGAQVTKYLVENDQIVGFGDPLFEVEFSP